MNELEQIFTEMLNHIDDHKEAYDKPQWTNEAIVKTWIKTNESKLKNLFISGVVKSFYCDNMESLNTTSATKCNTCGMESHEH